MEKSTQEQIDEINRKLDLFLSEYYRNNNPSSHIFTKKVYFKGGLDLSSPSVTIGAVGGTVGLYGETPVAQAGAISAPASQGATYDQTNVNTLVTAINAIRTALTNIGVTA